MTVYAVTGALLVALGLYGLIAARGLLRRVVAFNVVGSGVFLMFGALGWYEGHTDPVPQALIITGIVVALSASALAVGLVVAHARVSGGQVLEDDAP
ncbi:MAG: NADH-quinone oxidoreductase subunit K [Pararhodobacter sp.]|nr:NADH-quinone oxidoreductase subunit K [Pararhodobacter sp.]